MHADFPIRDRPVRLLFVCLGNICRSPLAEGVFAHLARDAGVDELFEVDSAGTGAWHVGEAPDPRSVETAASKGIELIGHARKVTPTDFSTFDLILAMDHDNLRDLERLRGQEGSKAKLTLLLQFDPEARGDLNVPDPYYGGPDGFDRVFEMVHRACGTLLQELCAKDEG